MKKHSTLTRLRNSKARSFLSIALSCLLSFQPMVQLRAEDLNLPAGGSAAQGKVTISQTLKNMQITQSTAKAVVNWKSFNIATDAKVNFTQPSSSSVILNRVNSANPSKILGSMTANGVVFLVNPGGVYFGKNAKIDVGALVASTGKITDQQFLQDRLEFDIQETASIINEGKISAGSVALVADTVINKGAITATQGDVVMASGRKVAVSLNGSQRISVAVTEGELNHLIDNQGTVEANGAIIIKANAMQKIVDQSINVPTSANMLVADNGVIRLVSNTGALKAKTVVADAGQGANYNNGKIDVSNTDGQGGAVELTGESILVASDSSIDASGSLGGGSILVGGDWQGQGDTPQATYTIVDKGATLNVSATEMGDGGSIVAWSDITNPLSTTSARGNLFATGGLYAGNGGQIETSGYHLSINDVSIDVSAKSGITGNWLIDPVDFTVAASGGDMTGSALTSGLASANVTILSSSGSSGSGGNITISDAVTWSANKLTLNANNNIYINANFLGSGTAQLDLLYGQGAVASGNTSDYSILKTSSGFSASVNLPDGNNFSTKLGSDGSTINYTVISSLASLSSQSGIYAIGSDIDANLWSSNGTTNSVRDNFYGTLDGLGHTIDDLTLVSSSGQEVGFTGWLNNAGTLIRNLGLTNIDYTNTNTNRRTGGFIASCQNSCSSAQIINSYVHGTIDDSSGYIGGLIGQVATSSNGATIKDSFSDVAITNTSARTGGIVGSNQGTLSIINTFNSGDITGNDSVGGLVGYSNSAFLEIDTSYNSGDIRNTRTSNSSVGGLVAEVLGSNANIHDSYNTGAISSARTGNQTSASDGSGGIVGYFNAGTSSKIQYAYNTGSVTDGRINIGGIVGVLWNSTVDQVYNSGAISGPQDVGGIVGANYYNGYVTNAYNTGQIGVSGVSASHVGGVVGRNDAYVQYAYGTGMVYGGWNGSVVGRQVRGYAKDLYGDNELTGIPSFRGTASQVTNANNFTTAQMKDLSNFTNFSGSLWSRFDSVNAGYPILSNNSPVSIVTFTANPLTKTYGESIDLSSFISNGLYSISGGTLASAFSVNPSFNLYSSSSLISDSTPDAGSYTITPSGGTLNSGFLASYINGALTVNPKALTVDSIAYSNKTYDGDAVANVTLSVSGTVGDETLSYTPTATFASRNVGSQTVTVNSISIADDTGDADNYSITTGQTGTATINQLSSVAWTGSGGNSFWSNANNWAGAALPDGNNVATANIGNSGTVTLNADSVGTMNSIINNAGALTLHTDSSYTLSSKILGGGSITKNGSGIFTLSSSDNNYTGNTTISAGTLQVSGLLGQGSYGSNIANAATLTLNTSANQTLSGSMSGSGSLIKAGASSLVLNGASSTFAGNVAINSGLIQIGDDRALGNTEGAISIASGAALDLNGKEIAKPITIAGTGISNSGAIYSSNTVDIAELKGNVTLDTSSTINSSGGLRFHSGILGQSGENNSLTISALNKTVTFDGLIGLDPYTYNGTNGANPYALSVTAGTININNNITTNQNQTYNGSVVIGGNLIGSSGTERILLSLNPSITINGAINGETANTNSLNLKAITQLGHSDTPSININGAVGNDKSLKGLTLNASYDPSPGVRFGIVPDIIDTSPLYNGSIIVADDVVAEDSITMVGRTIDLNDALLTADEVNIFGYAEYVNNPIELSGASSVSADNFRTLSSVNGGEYFAEEIRMQRSCSCSCSRSRGATRCTATSDSGGGKHQATKNC